MRLFGFSGPRRTDDAGALEQYVRAHAGIESNSATAREAGAVENDCCMAPHVCVVGDLTVALRANLYGFPRRTPQRQSRQPPLPLPTDAGGALFSIGFTAASLWP